MSAHKDNLRHTVDPTPPRYNLVERPLSIQEAADRKNERVKEAWDEYQRVLAEPLETHVSEFQEAGSATPGFDKAVFEVETRTHQEAAIIVDEIMGRNKL